MHSETPLLFVITLLYLFLLTYPLIHPIKFDSLSHLILPDVAQEEEDIDQEYRIRMEEYQFGFQSDVNSGRRIFWSAFL